VAGLGPPPWPFFPFSCLPGWKTSCIPKAAHDRPYEAYQNLRADTA
jgi:hypothetical protein